MELVRILVVAIAIFSIDSNGNVKEKLDTSLSEIGAIFVGFHDPTLVVFVVADTES